jgi:hypothetical protein
MSAITDAAAAGSNKSLMNYSYFQRAASDMASDLRGPDVPRGRRTSVLIHSAPIARYGPESGAIPRGVPGGDRHGGAPRRTRDRDRTTTGKSGDTAALDFNGKHYVQLQVARTDDNELTDIIVRQTNIKSVICLVR